VQVYIRISSFRFVVSNWSIDVIHIHWVFNSLSKSLISITIYMSCVVILHNILLHRIMIIDLPFVLCLCEPVMTFRPCQSYRLSVFSNKQQLSCVKAFSELWKFLFVPFKLTLDAATRLQIRVYRFSYIRVRIRLCGKLSRKALTH